MPARGAAAKKQKRAGSGKRAATGRSRRSMATSTRKKHASGKKTLSRKAAARKPPRRVSRKGASKKGAKVVSLKKGSKKKTVPSAKTAPKNAGRATTPASIRAAIRAKTAVRSISPSRVNVLTGPSRGFKPYQPKRGEEYMSAGQLEHFRQILLAWKRELMEEVDRTMHHMKDDAANFPDPNDRATQESEFGLELRTRDRERKLLKKIDSALARIDERSYGYCEETGDEIGLRRLEARPVATLCVEAQERRELAERQFRDREDHYR